MRTWLDKLLKKCPSLGHFPKASKSWIIAKEHKLEARAVFSDTNIKIAAVGKNYLGGFNGREDARNDYFKDIVEDLSNQHVIQNSMFRAPSSLLNIYP